LEKISPKVGSSDFGRQSNENSLKDRNIYYNQEFQAEKTTIVEKAEEGQSGEQGHRCSGQGRYRRAIEQSSN